MQPDPLPVPRPAGTIPVARPRLPAAQSVLPYLQQIAANAWYTNHGPLARRFQARLAEHWGLQTAEVALLSNATSALTLTLLASGARPGSTCLMPSWTFVASAGAVSAAGLVPHFVDICPATWAPDPAEIQRLASHHSVGAILIVAPFGAPIDLAAWDAVQRATGVPVIIDAAAAFDTLRAGGPMTVGNCPLIVSLHATKVFGIGEGGALLSRDQELNGRVRALAQFGFSGTRESILPGVNAKISEYTAAIGLAGLDRWREMRARWESVTRRYASLLPTALMVPPQFGKSWVSSTLNVIWPNDQPSLGKDLATHGVATLPWWGAGCHAQPAFRHCRSETLSVTELYAPRSTGLPFWPDLSVSEIHHVCGAVHDLLATTMPRRRAGNLLPA